MFADCRRDKKFDNTKLKLIVGREVITEESLEENNLEFVALLLRNLCYKANGKIQKYKFIIKLYSRMI